MSKRLLCVVVSIALVSGVAVAQGRVEIRPAGGAFQFLAGGKAVAAIVPFAGKEIAATDAVKEARPGVFEWTRTFAHQGKDHVRPVRLTMEVEALYA